MTSMLILHPGAMGVTVAATAAAGGHDVAWVAADRSGATSSRAAQAGLRRVEDLRSGVREADLVVSVCPPGAAIEVARSVSACGFGGVYLDANAVSPATAKEVASIISAGGADVVDGGIIGPPARVAGTTRMYMSGDRAVEIVDLFAAGPLDAIVVDGGIGAASALKVAYAAWTKGSAALLMAVAAFAESSGVTTSLRREWDISQPDLAARLELTAAGVAPKAWRFEGELADSAAAFADADLPDGFGAAAAELYRRLASFKDTEGTTVEAAVEAILHRTE